MSKLGQAFLVLPIVVLSAALSSAIAAPIDYDIDATATFPSYIGTNTTDNITGSFVYDPTAIQLISADITVSGPMGAGTYDVVPTSINYNGGDEIQVISSTSAVTQMSLVFSSDLGTTFDSLFNFEGLNMVDSNGTGTDYDEIEAPEETGGVTPTISTTPLPESLPLFAIGLAGLGFFGWRRKRRTQAVAA
jgi:hypothetical protein